MDAAAVGLPFPDHSGPSKHYHVRTQSPSQEADGLARQAILQFGDGYRIARSSSCRLKFRAPRSDRRSFAVMSVSSKGRGSTRTSFAPAPKRRLTARRTAKKGRPLPKLSKLCSKTKRRAGQAVDAPTGMAMNRCILEIMTGRRSGIIPDCRRRYPLGARARPLGRARSASISVH